MSKIMTFEEVEEFFDYIASLLKLDNHSFIVDEGTELELWATNVETCEDHWHIYEAVDEYFDDRYWCFNFDFKYERVSDDTIRVTRPDDGMIWTVRRLREDELEDN